MAHDESGKDECGCDAGARGWERGIGAQRWQAHRWWLCAWVGWKGRERKHRGHISRLLQGSLCVEGLLLLVDRPERARNPSDPREHGLGCKEGKDRQRVRVPGSGETRAPDGSLQGVQEVSGLRAAAPERGWTLGGKEGQQGGKWAELGPRGGRTRCSRSARVFTHQRLLGWCRLSGCGRRAVDVHH